MAAFEPGRVFVVFNPASNGGRAGKLVSRYLTLLESYFPGFAHGVTARSGDEASLARQALREGYQTIVAVGGDGTWSAVADEILSAGNPGGPGKTGDPGVTLGLLPAGTGNDFGRNLRIPQNDPEAAVRLLARGRVIRSDVGRILEPSRHEGRGEEPRGGRHFLNVVGFGFDVAAVDQARGARVLRGEILYKVAALQQIFSFPGFQVSLVDGEGPPIPRQTLMLTITNGEFFGGGFPIFPGATVQDGVLHACIVGDARPLRRLALFHQAGKGRHVGSPEVESLEAQSFSLLFPAPPRFEVDGDLVVASGTRVSVEVKKGALRVLAG